MKKNKIVIIIVVVILLIMAIIGIFFGFGFEKNFKSYKKLIVNNVWYINLLECYEDGVQVKKEDVFKTHPYVYYNPNGTYEYCYMNDPEILTDVSEKSCDYYNYNIDNKYIYVYGINGKNEEKYSYEVIEDKSTWLILTYGDENNYCVEKYLMARG